VTLVQRPGEATQQRCWCFFAAP